MASETSPAHHELVKQAAYCARQLTKQGFAVLEGFLSEAQLEELRLEADTLYELAEEERQRGSSAWGREAAASCVYESVPAAGCPPGLRACPAAYLARRGCWPLRPGVCRLLFDSHLAQLVRLLLGPSAVLFNDQYILKPPGSSLSAFGWHRDSDWCRFGEATHRPYISVWCALDDACTTNGCLVVQPGSQLAGEAEQQPQPVGMPLAVRAGTAILTSDSLLHCSGPNRSRHMRRAWMPQFSAAPLTWRAGGHVSLAIPLQPGTATWPPQALQPGSAT